MRLLICVLSSCTPRRSEVRTCRPYTPCQESRSCGCHTRTSLHDSFRAVFAGFTTTCASFLAGLAASFQKKSYFRGVCKRLSAQTFPESSTDQSDMKPLKLSLGPPMICFHIWWQHVLHTLMRMRLIMLLFECRFCACFIFHVRRLLVCKRECVCVCTCIFMCVCTYIYIYIYIYIHMYTYTLHIYLTAQLPARGLLDVLV